jgi:hypothetical protein
VSLGAQRVTSGASKVMSVYGNHGSPDDTAQLDKAERERERPQAELVNHCSSVEPRSAANVEIGASRQLIAFKLCDSSQIEK